MMMMQTEVGGGRPDPADQPGRDAGREAREGQAVRGHGGPQHGQRQRVRVHQLHGGHRQPLEEEVLQETHGAACGGRGPEESYGAVPALRGWY